MKFKLHEKDSLGILYLDVMRLIVPEQVSNSHLPKAFVLQSHSFRMAETITVSVQIPPGMVSLVFVGLHFKEGKKYCF